MNEAFTPSQPARFAQIGYTSGLGGFGVHSTSGELSGTELELLVRGADPERTDFGQSLPRFAAPEEVAQFHRNLVSAPISPGVAAAWHTAPAGADESGRTGNVFVHAVLDREAGAAGIRVIDSWRSPDWVTPYGSQEVRVSALPAGPPAPWTLVGRRQVCEFLLDPNTWRLGVFSRLLDELAEPRRDKGPFVLGVSSPDAGALWVGAVTHLMSPASAANLGFGVWETVRALQPDKVSRYELVCMPETELAGLRERFPHVAVLSESDDITPRDWGPDDTDGQLAWGALAVGMLSLADDPTEVLADADAMAHRVGDRNLARYWPLAMAMARRVDSWSFLSHPIAAVLRAGSPPEMCDHRDLLDTTVDLVSRHTGDTAAEAWAFLSGCPSDSPIAAVLQRLYVGRAVADEQWLRQEQGVPARRDRGWNPAAHPGLTADILAAVERIDGSVERQLRATDMVTLVDVLVRSGWPTKDPDALLDGRLLGSIDRAVRPVLAVEDEENALRSLQGLDRATLALIRIALSDWPLDIARTSNLPVGRRVSERILTWLYSAETTDTWPAQLSPLDLEMLSHVATASDDETCRSTARSALFEAALGMEVGEEETENRRQVLAVVAAAQPMSAAEILRLLEAGIRPTDSQVATAVLVADTEELPDVLDLQAAVSSRRDRPMLDDALRIIPLLTSQPAWGATSFETAVEVYAPIVVKEFTALWAFARRPVGTLWAGHVAAAVELTDVRTDPDGHWASLFPDAGTVIPGCAALFASLLSLQLTEQRSYDVLDLIAFRAMACDAASPRPLRAANPPAKAHALVDSDGRLALTSGLSSYYSGLDKESVAGCRDGLSHVVARFFPDSPEMAEFALNWFQRVSGSRGVGERLRNVSGRIFNR